MTTVFTLRMGTERISKGCQLREVTPAIRLLSFEGASLVSIGAPRAATVSLITREELEAAISGFIDILDVIDRDGDLEPDGCDEPSLGWTSTMATGNRFDLEENETEVTSRP